MINPEVVKFAELIEPEPKSDMYYRLYSYSDTFHMQPFRVLKHTPKGVWLDTPYKNKKGKTFVLNSGRKRFAYPDKSQAINSFIYRKAAQIRILERQLSEAQLAKAIALKLTVDKFDLNEYHTQHYLDRTFTFEE